MTESTGKIGKAYKSALSSMTGFGSAKSAEGALSVDVEIKSVNSRFLDLNVKGPKVYSSLEQEIKGTENIP